MTFLFIPLLLLETILWRIFLGSVWVFLLPQNVCCNLCIHTHICMLSVWTDFMLRNPADCAGLIISHTHHFISLITQHPGSRSWSGARTHTHSRSDEGLPRSGEKWWWGFALSFKLLRPPLPQTVLRLRENKSSVLDFCFRAAQSDRNKSPNLAVPRKVWEKRMSSSPLYRSQVLEY